MNGKINVLAVMDNMIDPLRFPHQAHDLTEARDVVAGLISAAVRVKRQYGADVDTSIDALIAELARIEVTS